MLRLRSIPLWSLLALLAMILLASWGLGGALAEAPVAEPPPERPGWTRGQAAAGTAAALRANEPVTIAVSAELAGLVKGRAALFYFSPTCPHCIHAIPEIKQVVAATPELQWIGVATGSAHPEDIEAFRRDLSPPFPIHVDRDASFARAVGVRSTPSLYIAEPAPAGDAAAPGPSLSISDAFLPWTPGSGPVLQLRLHPEDPFRSFQGYQGGEACAACHTQEAEAWQLSLHAYAYRTLYLRERADDEKCVGCHVTGMGQGGFVMGDHGSVLAGVTCEACHGPSGPHDGQTTEARVTCVGCHDAEHSVAFTVEKGLPHIDHFKVNGMSEEQIRARLTALMDGEAPRPLLAFPAGPNLGSESCKSCHAEEYKAWKKSPHARAMSSLQGPEREQVDCVSCHALAATVAEGPRAQAPTLADFRPEQGVGCEGCHGPGGAHVAQPRKDNIVGLGESCPECVIESICTSCHTPKWDPRWKLQPRLEAVGRHH